MQILPLTERLAVYICGYLAAMSYQRHVRPHDSVFIVSTMQTVAAPAPDHTPSFSPAETTGQLHQHGKS